MIGSNTVVGHHSVVGDHCYLAYAAVISGSVTIGHHSIVGCNAMIGVSVKIGPFNMIGDGAVVRKSTRENDVYIPAETPRAPLGSERAQTLLLEPGFYKGQ